MNITITSRNVDRMRTIVEPVRTGVARFMGPLNTGVANLIEDGYSIATTRNLAEAIMNISRAGIQETEDDRFISLAKGWTSEAAIYVPRKGIFLTRRSPILTSLTDDRNNPMLNPERPYELTSSQVDGALEDSVRVDNQEIPLASFGENELTSFLFGDIAQDYGNYLLLRSRGQQFYRFEIENVNIGSHFSAYIDASRNSSPARAIQLFFISPFSSRGINLPCHHYLNSISGSTFGFR